MNLKEFDKKHISSDIWMQNEPCLDMVFIKPRKKDDTIHASDFFFLVFLKINEKRAFNFTF